MACSCSDSERSGEHNGPMTNRAHIPLGYPKLRSPETARPKSWSIARAKRQSNAPVPGRSAKKRMYPNGEWVSTKRPRDDVLFTRESSHLQDEGLPGRVANGTGVRTDGMGYQRPAGRGRRARGPIALNCDWGTPGGKGKAVKSRRGRAAVTGRSPGATIPAREATGRHHPDGRLGRQGRDNPEPEDLPAPPAWPSRGAPNSVSSELGSPTGARALWCRPGLSSPVRPASAAPAEAVATTLAARAGHSVVRRGGHEGAILRASG